MPYLVMPLLRLFDYGGRARRREFWDFAWLTGVALALAATWDAHAGRAHAVGGIAGPVTVTVAVLLGLPLLTAAVRRLHDTGRPAGVLLVNLVPVAGQMITLCWLAQAGGRGANRFGVDPRGTERGPATRPLKPGFAAR